MTDRYYIEATFADLPHGPEELEELAENLMSGLLDLEEHKKEILDPSVGADLTERNLDVSLAVDAREPGEAIQIFMSCVQSTLHGIGISTPGWDVMIRAMSLHINNQRSIELAGA